MVRTHSSTVMSSRPTTSLKTEQLDMDSFFDFNAGTQPSPVTASSSKTDAMSPFDTEERQQFNGPSHDYGQFRQQVGLPVGSLANMPMGQNNGMVDGFNSGFGDLDFNHGSGWNSGLDLDADMNMDMTGTSAMTPMFFPNASDSQSDTFVNPSSVGGHDEPASNVGRLWPGMHSQQAQQAAMQKAAQAHAVQQRQVKLQAQQAHYRQASQSSQPNSQSSSQSTHTGSNAKRASHAAEPHVEESISRLLSQMRQNNAALDDDASSPSSGLLPHIARMKKDEDDMDEDERLLASDEGKKLSSKERRQLRNKVSARAFRSRRKEYITQLEGEVALKTQEANGLRNENQALMQENERYRGLIETLLRHPSFTPFINDISRDPSVLGMPQQLSQPQRQQQPQNPPQQQQQQQQPQQQQPPAPPQQQQQQQSQSQQQMQSQPQQQQQDSKPSYLNFDASQIQVPQPQSEQLQVGMTMVAENDFSKLNLNGFDSMNFNNFNVQQAYAVATIPAGPNPVDLLVASPARLPISSNASSTDCTTTPSLTVLLAKLDGAASRMKDVTNIV